MARRKNQGEAIIPPKPMTRAKAERIRVAAGLMKLWVAGRRDDVAAGLRRERDQAPDTFLAMYSRFVAYAVDHDGPDAFNDVVDWLEGVWAELKGENGTCEDLCRNTVPNAH